MGIEVAVAISAAALAVGTYTSVQSNQAQKKAAGKQQEASDISQAQQRQQEMDARRNTIRQQRIRQAQIEQGAANTGTTGSSGELGSLSALSTNAGSKLASMSGASLASQGIGDATQAAVNYQGDAQTWNSYGQIAQGIGSVGSAAAMKLGVPSDNKTPKLNNSVDDMLTQNPDLF